MRAALLTVLLAGGALGFSGCHKPQPQNQAEKDMSIEGNLADGQLSANAQIETLPSDESSGTSNNELATGEDNPDVNDLGNSH